MDKNKNKLIELDNELNEYANNNFLNYCGNINVIDNIDKYILLNCDHLFNGTLKGYNIRAIGLNGLKNVHGYFIDYIFYDLFNFDIIICVPIFGSRKFITLNSTKYKFYFKPHIYKSKNKKIKDFFLSILD